MRMNRRRNNPKIRKKKTRRRCRKIKGSGKGEEERLSVRKKTTKTGTKC